MMAKVHLIVFANRLISFFTEESVNRVLKKGKLFILKANSSKV